MIKASLLVTSMVLAALSTPARAQTTWLVKNSMEIVEIKIKDKVMERKMREIVKGSQDSGNAMEMCVEGDFGAFFEKIFQEDLDCVNFKKEPAARGIKFSATCEEFASTTHIFPKDKSTWEGEVRWRLLEKDAKMSVKGKFTAQDTGVACEGEKRKSKKP